MLFQALGLHVSVMVHHTGDECIFYISIHNRFLFVFIRHRFAAFLYLREIHLYTLVCVKEQAADILAAFYIHETIILMNIMKIKRLQIKDSLQYVNRIGFKARCWKPPGHYVMHTWAR